MTGIFISYRRDDSRHAAGRLVDRLAQSFHREQLFMDVDAIDPGLDFIKVLNERVGACDVFLAVIGPDWINSKNENGLRRLDDPNDFVRIEIEAALKRDIRVIPVLVDGAQMPRSGNLPQSLAPLASRHAVRLTHERFGTEATALASSLKSVVGGRRGWQFPAWWPGVTESKPTSPPSTTQDQVLLRVAVFIMHVLAAVGGLFGGFFTAFGMMFLINWLGWRVVPTLGPQSTDAPRALMLGLVCAGMSIAAGIILCKNFGRPRAYLASFLIASGIAQIAINLAFLGGVWRWGQETVLLSYFVIAIAIVILWQVRLRAW